jgi:diguanylate cyclase (GGDEF)-like protein
MIAQFVRPQRSRSHSDSRGLARILYVEDSPVQAAYVKSVLESGGYLARSCADPTSFLLELERFRPALVLMDVLLPGVDGLQLVRRLRQEERYANLPVLFLTTEGETQDRIEAMRAGADDHLVKPVDPGLLLSAVQNRLERSRRLGQMIDRDGLTRLLNHTALLDRARHFVERQSGETRRRATWIMIDLDRFKSVNDRFGHPVGDRVLAATAEHLSRNVRRRDAVGRCGGEEFAILLDGVSEEEAVDLAHRLREEFASLEHDGGGFRFHVTFSAGIAELRPGMDVDRWRETADRALYTAKAAGRNRVALGDPHLVS